MYKTLGIIGGMGPLATVKLFKKIVLKTDADCDQEHIHILIDNNTQIPSRPNFIMDSRNENPKHELIKSAKKLESIGADFLVMPCNTAHYFYNDIIEVINIPFLNMIDLTLKHLEENYPYIRKIGLLSTEGTIQAKIYDQVFKSSHIEILKPDVKEQSYINDLISSVKQGITDHNLNSFYETIDNMNNQGVELFIAACTEISVALDLYELKGTFLDPLDILTSNAIKLSGRQIKKI